MENLETVLLNPMVVKIAAVVLVVIFINASVRFLQRFIGRRIRDKDARYRVRKAIVFLSYLLIIVIALSIFSDQLNDLSVMFGLIIAGVAFALQEVIVSVAGWLAISFGDFYRVGNRVQLGGIMGDVIDISVLRTTLMECGDWVNADLYNGRIVRIANSFVFKEPVYNYSADFPYLWDEITLPIKYGSDRELVDDILVNAADAVIADYLKNAQNTWQQMTQKYAIEDASIEPLVTLIVTDNWLAYTLRFVTDYRRRRRTKDELFRRIMDEIDASNGRVDIASTTIHLVETPTLDVHLGGAK